MIGRRAVVALVLIALCVGLSGLVLVRLPGSTPDPSSSPGPSATHASPSSRPDEAMAEAFQGPSLLPGAPVEPAGRPTQSRLWVIDGVWYGVAIDPASRESRIARLAADGSAWEDSGVLIDERSGAMVDALWDGSVLLTVSSVPGRSTANGVRVTRFRLDDSGRFVRDPNFPVPLTERGVTAATIARDSTGRAWVAFVQDGAALLSHSTTDDALWVAPAAIPGSGPVGEDDLAAVAAVGDGRLAVAWSDTPASSVRLVLRDDAADSATWGSPEEAFSGLALAARPISLAAAAGRVVIGIQTTETPEDPKEANDPDSLIAVRDPDGAWRTALTSRVSDRLGSPVVAIDPDGGDVYAFLMAPRRGGLVYLKRSPIERLEFPTGRGLVVIDHPVSPPTVSSLTVPKSPVRLSDAFLVQGLDVESGIPWHAVVRPAGSGPTPSIDPGEPSPTPAASGPPSARVLIDDDFAPWPEGDPIGGGWEIAPADARGTLVAAGKSTGTRHAALRSDAADAVRACKDFPLVSAGDLVADVVVQADAIADGDVIITSLRSGSSESASVRFGQGGTFAYYAGATKVRTTAANRLGEWLHSRVTVHLDTATYDWRLTTEDGTVIVNERGIPFREPVDGASSVCIGTSSGPGRPVVRFDDVRVAH